MIRTRSLIAKLNNVVPKEEVKVLKAGPIARKQYEYQTINEIQVDDKLHNFFGVVMDASFPHKSAKSGRYFCTLRLADPSQPLSAEGVVETCTLVLIANKFEELPITQRVGDIIRVHRATVSEYLGFKQLTARVYFNSSWILFSPITQTKELGFVPLEQKSDCKPFRHLGKSYSEVNKNEQIILKKLRIWIEKSFMKQSVIDTSRRVVQTRDLQNYHEEGKAEYDFDMIVKISKIQRVDEKTSEISVKDNEETTWTTAVSTFKFRWLREGQVVKIKHASLVGTEKDSHHFVLKSMSNILSLPKGCKVQQDM